MNKLAGSNKPVPSFRTVAAADIKAGNCSVTLAPATVTPDVPDYLQDVYYWAYINPRNV
jgi:hypothetical protein